MYRTSFSPRQLHRHHLKTHKGGKETIGCLETFFRRYLFYSVGTVLFSMLIMDTPSYPATTGEKDVETLDMIEITGTAVEQEGRTITFPVPEWPQPLTPSSQRLYPSLSNPVRFEERTTVKPQVHLLIDSSTESKRAFYPVKPLQAERPPFPRQAREQGWQGVVLLHLAINEYGKVENATVKESSGYPLLDSTAVQTVKQWTFEPAKNGNFPVSSLVNLPIKFDLRQ